MIGSDKALCAIWHDNRTGNYDIYYYARPLSKALLNDNLSFCESSCNAVRVWLLPKDVFVELFISL
ncbi:MAG: hypothetical protein QME47_02475 [Candidatus Thermoplasmatota archaeon]|nr:hypothetical protein [Candidatus Thermoplasmatota archaeon]